MCSQAYEKATSALHFLRKDTLDAAQNDAEQLVMDKMAIKAKLIERLDSWKDWRRVRLGEENKDTRDKQHKIGRFSILRSYLAPRHHILAGRVNGWMSFS